MQPVCQRKERCEMFSVLLMVSNFNFKFSSMGLEFEKGLERGANGYRRGRLSWHMSLFLVALY